MKKHVSTHCFSVSVLQTQLHKECHLAVESRFLFTIKMFIRVECQFLKYAFSSKCLMQRLGIFTSHIAVPRFNFLLCFQSSLLLTLSLGGSGSSQVFVPETHMGDLDWAPASWHWPSLTLVANGKSVCLSVSLYLSSNEKYILKLT